MEKLAIDGGSPVRDRQLPANYPGAIVMGEEEAKGAEKVIMAQSPFRFYGENLQYSVDTLEDMMAKDLDVPYVLGVSSCTAGLIVALKALGIGYGDKVIVPGITFIATPGAVISANAVPVFADVDESMNMDPDCLEQLIDKDVKAIIPVALSGVPCDMDPIMKIARKHNIYVIEDIAQSCGVKYKGRYQGTIGDIGVFSFQMNKMLTAGEGGAVVTSDPKLFERAVRYHDQGSFRKGIRKRYGIDAEDTGASFAGQNYRMSEITGAVLIEQWKRLESMTDVMRSHYQRILNQLITALPNLKYRNVVDEQGHLGANLGMSFPTQEIAAKFAETLAAENIACRFMYGGNTIYRNELILHQRTAEKNNFPFDYPFEKPVQYTENLCPNAEDYIQRMVLIALSPSLTKKDVDDVVAGVIKVYQGLNL